LVIRIVVACVARIKMQQDVHRVDQCLPVPKLVTLGIQHVLVMYASTVAVPLIPGAIAKITVIARNIPDQCGSISTARAAIYQRSARSSMGLRGNFAQCVRVAKRRAWSAFMPRTERLSKRSLKMPWGLTALSRAIMRLDRLVALSATSPAKLFGLFPRTGTIAIGSDADLVLFDPNATTAVRAAEHHSQVDYSLFEGRRLRGAVRKVFSRGELIVDGKDWSGVDAGQNPRIFAAARPRVAFRAHVGALRRYA
jgi:Amidohydrolase family